MASNRNPANESAIDLTTRYMGLPLRNPLIASASPITGELDTIRHIEDAGAAAVVLPSIFEEQIEQEVCEYEHLRGIALDGFPEVASFYPKPGFYKVDPHKYLDLIRRAVDAVDQGAAGRLHRRPMAGVVDAAGRFLGGWVSGWAGLPDPLLGHAFMTNAHEV
jgi:hypothetical protein